MNLRSPVKKPVLMVKKFQRQHIIGAILLIFALVFSSFAVSIRLAGPAAMLRSLLLRWAPDATLLILK